MAVSDEQIAIIKGLVKYRSPDGKGFRHQDISAYFGINSARVTEIRYGDRGVGNGIEPAPQSKFPEICWDWPLIPPTQNRRVLNLRKKKMLCQRGVDIAEINKKIRPLVRFFLAQGHKNMATVQFSAILLNAAQLGKYLDEWNETFKKPKGTRR